jgi:hypothetical protein
MAEALFANFDAILGTNFAHAMRVASDMLELSVLYVFTPCRSTNASPSQS